MWTLSQRALLTATVLAGYEIDPVCRDPCDCIHEISDRPFRMVNPCENRNSPLADSVNIKSSLPFSVILGSTSSAFASEAGTNCKIC